MTKRVSSLSVHALAALVLEHATIEEAQELIKTCGEVIQLRQNERNRIQASYAKELIPSLSHVHITRDFGFFAITYVFLTKNKTIGSSWYWIDDMEAPSAACNYSMQMGPDGWRNVCPEFTLETHLKIIEFIKKTH